MKWLWLLLILVLLVAIVWWKPWKSPDTNPGVADSGRPECPVDSVAYRATRTKDRQVTGYTATTIPIAGPNTNVPEYHDCQRFIVNRQYGPMVAIFAHHALDSAFGRIVDSATGDPLQAAAEIYSYDGDYAPLGIRTGFNCLYLRKQGSEWHALMTWADREAEACLQPPGGGERLEVRMVPKPFNSEHLPPVARWDWDPVDEQQYISIRCGDDWCEVGRSGFHSAASLAVTLPDAGSVPGLGSPTPEEKDRILKVRGWYDEQYLALPAVSGAGLEPSLIRGTAIPHPLLDRMGLTDHFKYRWTPSAYLVLDAPPNVYSGKLGLAQGVNEVFMCFGKWGECDHPADVAQPACQPGADGQWWGKVVQPGQRDTSYFCVHRRTHPGAVIPGAVRWRWDEDDEKTWIRCPEGCCTLN